MEHSLDPLLEWWERDPREEPYPPEYPKMPGEPKRVQPSKNRTDTSGNIISPARRLVPALLLG